jgi:cysteine-rich repeat protein
MKLRISKLIAPMFFLSAAGCPPPPPDPFCGDELTNGAEACDDGNQVSGDGCENDCTLTPPETTDSIFVTQVTEMRDAALLVKEAAQANNLAQAQQNWRVLWQRSIKVRYPIEQLSLSQAIDPASFIRLFSPIGLHENPGLPGVHGVEGLLFGRTPDVAAVPDLIDAMVEELDSILDDPPTISEEIVFRSMLTAYRLPIELFAASETPLAGPDEDAFRNVFISLSGYLDLIPNLLADAPDLQAAVDALGQSVSLDADALPALISASVTLSQNLAQTAQDQGLSVGVTPQDDFSQLTIPRQFGDNFTLAANSAAISLGKDLFFDPILSSPRNDRSCSSCHHPDKNFTDNRAKGLGLDGLDLPRATPTIFNAALQVGSFWDARVNDLPDQALRPIEAAQEMGTDLNAALAAVAAIPEYVARFDLVFADGITANNMGLAIATWESSQTLLLLNSPVDQFLAGDLNALDASQQRGSLLYWGKARCGNCHIAPIYGGTRALDFSQTDLRVVGVPQDAAGTILDPDLGKGALPGESAIDNGAFKVPILRNLTQTAPYMHNGVFATLDQVIDFYNAGGGPGLNLSVPNADPRMIKLNLTPAEKADLKAFLEALTDTDTASLSASSWDTKRSSGERERLLIWGGYLSQLCRSAIIWFAEL